MNVKVFAALCLPAALCLWFATTTLAGPEGSVRKAASFAIGGVGFTGTMSQGERALRDILAKPDAVSRLESMISDATPAGKLYALLGLRARDRAAYARALEKCRAVDVKITTVRGCTIGPDSFRSVLNEITSGEYDLVLARDWSEGHP